MTGENDKNNPRGLIRYVLLVVSHPVEPTMPQMSAFLLRILPEVNSQPNGSVKLGFLWDKKPISSIDIPALAKQTFGNDVADASRFTYRTLRHKMQGGDTECLVIYDALPHAHPTASNDTNTPTSFSRQASSGKWWQFWK